MQLCTYYFFSSLFFLLLVYSGFLFSFLSSSFLPARCSVFLFLFFFLFFSRQSVSFFAGLFLFFFLFFFISGGLVFSLIVSVETQSVTISWWYIWFLAPNRTMLYRHLQHHNDTIIKKTQWQRQTQEDFFRKISTSHFIARVRKGLLKVCVWEGAWDRTEIVIFWPLLLRPSTLCLSRSPDAQPEVHRPTLLGDGFLYSILSATSLVPKLHRGSRGPLSRVYLSLPHLHSNWLELQLYCLDFRLDWVI